MMKIKGISVYTHGKTSSPAVTFIHGFPFDASMWAPQISALQENYFCVSYDIRGLGGSEFGDGQFTIDTFADDLFMILNEYDIQKTVVCGLSMGGYIALRAVEMQPERFNGIILCDTKAEADTNAGKNTRNANLRKIDNEGAEAFVRGFMPTCVYQPNIASLGSSFSGLMDKYALANPAALKACQIAMAARTDTTPALAGINVPSLVICGEHDSFSPPSVMKNMAQAIPGSKFVEVADAGHLAPFEKPEVVNKEILAFLSSL